MNYPPTLSIITTTDPRARQLPFLLEELSALASKRNESYEVVIVDDLSQWEHESKPDHSCYPSLFIKAITPTKKQGQLQAIMKGFKEATGEILLTIDPDLHPCVPEIPNMVTLIDENTLAVHAVRKSRSDASIFRLTASFLVNLLVRSITGLKVKDIGSPISLLHRDALNLLPEISKKNTNPRLTAYLELGEKLTFYNLSAGADSKTPSHYKVVHLVSASWALLKASFLLRKTLRHQSK
jgi:undecaprenyl-phosphate 4-deoxy-4-formamido-L-arabinose transferase